MTPEERSEAITNKYEQTCMGWLTGNRYDNPNHMGGVRVGPLQKQIEDAIRAAVAEEREAIIALLCGGSELDRDDAEFHGADRVPGAAYELGHRDGRRHVRHLIRERQ